MLTGYEPDDAVFEVEANLVRAIEGVEGDPMHADEALDGVDVHVWSASDSNFFAARVVGMTEDHTFVICYDDVETGAEVQEEVPLAYLRQVELQEEYSEEEEDANELAEILEEFGLSDKYEAVLELAGGATSAPALLRQLDEKVFLGLKIPILKARKVWKRVQELAAGRPSPSESPAPGDLEEAGGEGDLEDMLNNEAEAKAGGEEDLIAMLGGSE
jgi:hypothetical protein